MRRTLSVWAFVAVLFAIVSSAMVAETKSSSTMNKDAGMDWLVGTWTCVSKVSAMPKTPAHTETDTMTFQWAVNHMWMSQQYNGKAYSGQSYWRWDNAAKKLVSVGVDSFGGYGMETSPGMQGGNSMTMSGTMTYGGHPSPVEDLLTKISDTKMRHVGRYSMNGKWMQTDDTTCTKNS